MRKSILNEKEKIVFQNLNYAKLGIEKSPFSSTTKEKELFSCLNPPNYY